jgi:hypothetical protein
MEELTKEQWALRFEEPYRTQALEYLKTLGTLKNRSNSTISNCVSSLFVWGCSPQKHTYWSIYQDELIKGTKKLNIEDCFVCEGTIKGNVII